MFASTIGYAGGFVSPQTLQKYRPRIYSEMFKNLVDRFERFMTQTYIAENADKCRGRIGIRLVLGTADDSIELQRQIVSLGARYGLEIDGIEVQGAKHSLQELTVKRHLDDLVFASRSLRSEE